MLGTTKQQGVSVVPETHCTRTLSLARTHARTHALSNIRGDPYLGISSSFFGSCFLCCSLVCCSFFSSSLVSSSLVLLCGCLGLCV